MTTLQTTDAVDTRAFLRAYAVIVSAVGFTLFGWGDAWLGSSLADNPYGKALILRISGGIIMAAGCCAAGFAQIKDPASRHRALFWFLLAHVLLLVVLITQILGPTLPSRGDLSFYGLCAATALVFYFWLTGDGYRASDVFGHTASATERLRSEYEERIRDAASQEERNRLARELHDSIKQQIFAMQTAAATAQARFDADAPGAKAALDQMRESARDAMTEMEAMLDNLRATPLENLGLVEALKRQCEALALRTGADVRFEPGPLPPSENLVPGAQQAIFRIAQEALANVGRHARARSVLVKLGSRDRRVVLEIEDDGSGFEPSAAPEGMGLRNMRARAEALNGELNVARRAGGGTCVRLSVPYTLPVLAVYRRRRAIWTAIVGGLIGARVAIELMLFHRVMITIADLLLFFVLGVILWREKTAYYRAVQRSKAAWLESPSHS